MAVGQLGGMGGPAQEQMRYQHSARFRVDADCGWAHEPGKNPREGQRKKKTHARKKSSSGHPEEGSPEPTKEPDSKPNPLVVMWANADSETRREFALACWDEIMRARDQVAPANPNGNAGASHWAHLSKENTEMVDRWIEEG
jgi:hypothetical protein